MLINATRFLAAGIAISAFSLLPACGGGSGTSTLIEAPSVNWTLQGLEPLGAGFVYEGWVISDGAPVSTGRFNVDGAGTPAVTSFPLTAAVRDASTTFVLTVEPDPDPSPAPSDTKILGGDFASGSASLSIGHPAALGDDFMTASGIFILATPTSASTADETQGIWFLNPAGPAAGLNVPALPAGWTYEGWVVGPSGPVSTGRFDSPDGPDADAGGATAGTDNPAPQFPGQDFVTPAVNLVGQVAVITVEPNPDDSPMPFAFKPLVRNPIDGAIAPNTQTLGNNVAASAPTGTATLK